MMRRRLAAAIAVLVWAACAGGASAAETVRVGVLKFGTVNWELDTISHHGLDAANGIAVETVMLASNEATKVALQAGAVDVIASDWLWVSRQRADGVMLTFVPFSSSVGAVMVAADSPIHSIADLVGKRIGVAGGPLDKSWLLLQGLARRDDGLDLASAATPVFAAPPLLAQQLRDGGMDAALNYWSYNAALGDGFRELIGIKDVARRLGASGPVAAIGYVFDETWARRHPAAIAGFIEASREAKALLKTSDTEWDRLRPLMRAADGAEFVRLRDGFRSGIPARPIADEAADAARLNAVLAEIGGEALVGKAITLTPGTYWPGAAP